MVYSVYRVLLMLGDVAGVDSKQKSDAELA